MAVGPFTSAPCEADEPSDRADHALRPLGVAETTRPYGIKTNASLNPIMIDGTGMCGACRVSVGGKTRFACVDGPEFDGHEVDFAELRRRLGAFRDQETISIDAHRRAIHGN